MAAIHGRLTLLTVGAVTVSKKTDATLTIDRSMVETTNHDDSGNRTYIAGHLGFSLSANIIWDDTDAGQEDLIDSIVNGASATFVFEPENTSGTHSFSGSGFVNNISLTGPQDAPHGMNVGVQGTGALTRTAAQ